MPRRRIIAFPVMRWRSPFTAPPGRAGRDRRHLVIFHREQMDAEERALVERDRGVALCRYGAAGAGSLSRCSRRRLAARLDDVTAWECKGHALAGLGRNDEALAAFQKAIIMDPRRESALVEAARVAAILNRRKDAAAYWERAIAINPWRSDYYAELAFVYFNDGDWQASAGAAGQALRLNSSSAQSQEVARTVLSESGKYRGRARRARDGPWLRSAGPGRPAPVICGAVEFRRQGPVRASTQICAGPNDQIDGNSMAAGDSSRGAFLYDGFEPLPVRLQIGLFHLDRATVFGQHSRSFLRKSPTVCSPDGEPMRLIALGRISPEIEEHLGPRCRCECNDGPRPPGTSGTRCARGRSQAAAGTRSRRPALRVLGW